MTSNRLYTEPNMGLDDLEPVQDEDDEQTEGNENE
jgi:hypothetical protein